MTKLNRPIRRTAHGPTPIKRVRKNKKIGPALSKKTKQEVNVKNAAGRDLVKTYYRSTNPTRPRPTSPNHNEYWTPVPLDIYGTYKRSYTLEEVDTSSRVGDAALGPGKDGTEDPPLRPPSYFVKSHTPALGNYESPPEDSPE